MRFDFPFVGLLAKKEDTSSVSLQEKENEVSVQPWFELSDKELEFIIIKVLQLNFSSSQWTNLGVSLYRARSASFVSVTNSK